MALLSVEEAQRRVLEGVAPLPPEDAPLAQAAGRILAGAVVARRTQPPADVSAMDGYAVRAADVAAAGASLAVVGSSAAGHPFAGAVGPGEAVRIFTGAVVPAGADTVVIQEDCEAADGRVAVRVASRAGRHIRLRGLDFARGDAIFPAGRRLTARDVGLAAALNHATLPVHRRPRVVVFSTGDELVLPGGEVGPDRIVSSNAPMIGAMLADERAHVTDLGLVPDRLEATAAAVRAAKDADADLLVTTGGASVGEHDLVQRALKDEGMALDFWRIALRPGRPLIFGRLGDLRVLGLPGNPVSSFVCMLLFVLPVVRALAGHPHPLPSFEPARLGIDLPANDQRTDYLRANLDTAPDGALVATPFPLQDSSMMSLLARADCCLVRAPFEPAARAGDPCRIVRLG